MRARKLSLAEAHPSQVVKVEVDVPSQYTAILLRNASCLLYSSLANSPSLIVPSCTDVCFLRLRQRNTHLCSSSSSDKSAERFPGSDHRKHLNAKGKSSMYTTEGIDASLGSVEARSVNEVLVFLALRPGKGSVSVDLLAWRCNGMDIVPTPIFLDGRSNDFNGTLAARLDEISVGISAGLLASINVVTVHAPANGKLWIFSAKQSNTKSQGLIAANKERDQVEMGNEKYAKEITYGLQLVKSAVVDCDGPVYSTCLSMQHLLVGQLGGVRVWLLRPLIKGPDVLKNHVRAAANCRKYNGTRQERTKLADEEESAKSAERFIRVSNGSFSTGIERNGPVSATKNCCDAPAAPKNGLYELSFNESFGMKSSFLNGNCCTSGNATGTKQAWGYNEPVLLESGGTLHEKDGTLSDFDLEELKSQQKYSQISMLSSCSDSSSSTPHLQTAYPRSASCQSLTSSLSSVAGVAETICAAHKSELKKGTSAGVFVAFQKGHPTSSGKAEQVIKIHGLSEKDFLVLDSNGKLYTLTLQYATHKDEPSVHQAQRVSLNACFQHLWCGIRIKHVSAVPESGGNPRNPGFALRKFWVSDGENTLYMVTIPRKEHVKEYSRKNQIVHDNYLTVMETVFLMERACSLAALNENAVLVHTEGCMLEYSNGS